MGRHKKPLPLHILHGTLRQDRANMDAPLPPVDIPACPPELDTVGQNEWVRITAHLYRLDMIAEIDLAVIAGYCHCFEQFIKSAEQLKKTGYLIKSPTGYPIINPIISINARARGDMLAFAKELGLTVIQRTKIKIDNKTKDISPLEKFIKKEGN